MPTEAGTPESPWVLKTPPLTSDYTMHRDTRDGRAALVCTVGKTVLYYDARCLDDLHAMLTTAGDWVELGSADEQKDAKAGTVEAWGRAADNPVGGWYGLKKGLRGRFGMYVPPLMERLGHGRGRAQSARESDEGALISGRPLLIGAWNRGIVRREGGSGP